jgi:hypothetical protein
MQLLYGTISCHDPELQEQSSLIASQVCSALAGHSSAYVQLGSFIMHCCFLIPQNPLQAEPEIYAQCDPCVQLFVAVQVGELAPPFNPRQVQVVEEFRAGKAGLIGLTVPGLQNAPENAVAVTG